MKALIACLSRSVSSDPNSPLVSQYFCDNAIRPPPPGATLGGQNVASVVFEDRLLRLPTLARELAGDLTSLSPGTGAGTIELANADGALDATKAQVWRAIKVWLWDMDTPIDQALFLFSADCSRAEYLVSSNRPKRVIIPLIDSMARLDRPLQQSVYAGTNNGTSVLYEGEAGGIAGQPKPWLIGAMNAASGGVDGPAPHLRGLQVNGPARVFQVHAGGVDGIEVNDRGVSSGLAFDGNYVGVAFDARVLPAASFATDRARGLIKVTDGLIGPMTLGARRTAGLSGGVATPGACVLDVVALANQSGGAKANLQVDASQMLAGLDLAGSQSGPCGWWFDGDVSVREALAPFARAAGGVVAARRNGGLLGRALQAPSGPASLVIEPQDIVDLEVGNESPAPVGEVRVNWGRVWTPIDGSDLAPSLRGTDQAARLAQSWRTAVKSDEATKARAADWRVVSLDTALRGQAAAEAVATRLLGLFALRPDGQARRTWSLVVAANPTTLGVELGAIIRVIWPPSGLDELMVVLGEKLCAPRRDLLTWSVWA
jgi:hypothetical protein